MAKVVKHKPKAEQNPHEEARKLDAYKLAELLYDIYQEKKMKEVDRVTVRKII